MSRKSRVISPTGVYHVMLRGINRGRIFDDEQDCRKFVGSWSKYIRYNPLNYKTR